MVIAEPPAFASRVPPAATVAPVTPAAPTAPAPFKLKVKLPKPVNDGIPIQIVPPMAPPPVPPSRKSSFVAPAEPTKKRKSLNSELDDMLGAEVDAIANPSPRVGIPEVSEPKAKKQKTPRPDPPAPVVPPRPTITFSKPVSQEKKRQPSPEKNRHASPEKKRAKEYVAPVPPPVEYAPEPITAPVSLPVLHYAQPVPPPDLPATKGNTMAFKAKRARTLITTLQKDASAGIVSVSRCLCDVSLTCDVVLDACRSYCSRVSDIL